MNAAMSAAVRYSIVPVARLRDALGRRGRLSRGGALIRAFSLTQPLATIVGRGLKPVENRDKFYREVISGDEFAIHASLNWDEKWAAKAAAIAEATADAALTAALAGPHEKGAIIAVARSKGYLHGYSERMGVPHLAVNEVLVARESDPRLMRWSTNPASLALRSRRRGSCAPRWRWPRWALPSRHAPRSRGPSVTTTRGCAS